MKIRVNVGAVIPRSLKQFLRHVGVTLSRAQRVKVRSRLSRVPQRGGKKEVVRQPVWEVVDVSIACSSEDHHSKCIASCSGSSGQTCEGQLLQRADQKADMAMQTLTMRRAETCAMRTQQLSL